MIQKEFLSRVNVIIGISRFYTYIPRTTCELLPSRELSTNNIIFWVFSHHVSCMHILPKNWIEVSNNQQREFLFISKNDDPS